MKRQIAFHCEAQECVKPEEVAYGVNKEESLKGGEAIGRERKGRNGKGREEGRRKGRGRKRREGKEEKEEERQGKLLPVRFIIKRRKSTGEQKRRERDRREKCSYLLSTYFEEATAFTFHLHQLAVMHISAENDGSNSSSGNTCQKTKKTTSSHRKISLRRKKDKEKEGEGKSEENKTIPISR